MGDLKRCEVCGKTGSDRAHVITQGAGAGWEDFEWMYLCRRHHQEQGVLNWHRFCEKYPKIVNILNSKGWKLEKIFNVWKVKKI